MSAVDYMNLIRRWSAKNWMSPPGDRPTVNQIIDNMSCKHTDYMQSELRAFATTKRAVKGGQCTNISFDSWRCGLQTRTTNTNSSHDTAAPLQRVMRRRMMQVSNDHALDLIICQGSTLRHMRYK